MANDPNTYYAKPNEVVDGSKLPSNIVRIQGAGGNTIKLADSQAYFAGIGNNTVSGTGNNFYGWDSKGASGDVILNLKTGIVSNNGFGGSDQISNIKFIGQGYNLNSITAIFDNEIHNIDLGQCTSFITGNGGNSAGNFASLNFSQTTLKINSASSYSVTNNLNGKVSNLTNVGFINFNDVEMDMTNPFSIGKYFNPFIKSFYFAGETLNISIKTENVNTNSPVKYWFWNNPNNNYQYLQINSPTTYTDQSGIANISIQLSKDVPNAQTYNFGFGIPKIYSWNQNPDTFTVLPSAKLIANSTQGLVRFLIFQPNYQQVRSLTI